MVTLRSAGLFNVWVEEICQISSVVIKISTKHTFRLLNLSARWLVSAGHMTKCAVAVRCLEPALSGACLPTASAAALSGSYFTHWQLKEAPLFFSFSRIICHHGRQKEPYQVRRPSAVDLASVRHVSGSRFGCVSLTQRSFLPFSLGMPQLARIVQSLWRLLAPYKPVTSTDKEKCFRGYVWQSL